MNKFKNYIFDWSGTLVDDLGPVLDSTNRVFNYYGKDSFTRDEFCSEFCLPFKNFYDKFLPEVPMSELELLYTKFFNQSDENVFCFLVLKKYFVNAETWDSKLIC